MNENDIKNLPEYAQKLPKPVLDLIVDGVWKDRAEEIAKKYSLSPAQTDTLINNILFVITGIDTIDDFLSLMSSELGVSKLLASQITDDLEKRVFEYVLKTLDAAKISDVNKGTIIEKGSNLPEIAPDMLPAKTDAPIVKHEILEKQKEPAVANPPKAFVPRYIPESSLAQESPSKPAEVKPESVHITYTQNKTNEPIQRPVSVPRFTATPISETLEAEIKTPEVIVAKPIVEAPKVANIIDAKLNMTPATPKPVTPPEPAKIEKKYILDPYREPLE